LMETLRNGWHIVKAVNTDHNQVNGATCQT
jgi:hypothetical protein